MKVARLKEMQMPEGALWSYGMVEKSTSSFQTKKEGGEFKQTTNLENANDDSCPALLKSFFASTTSAFAKDAITITVANRL